MTNNIKETIKEFQEKYCNKCKSFFLCGGEMVLSCKDFNKYLKEKSK